MTRYHDWEARLNDYLAAMRGQPFIYGALDCALFACGAVEAMTGVDPAAQYRGIYSTEKGAAKVLRKLGKGTLEATFDDAFSTCPAGFVQRGDLVWSGERVGVSIGHAALFIGELNGKPDLIPEPRATWVKGWRVV